MTDRTLPLQDWGPLGRFLVGAVGLAFGALVGWLVWMDGRLDLRLQIDLFGPELPLVDDLPFLPSLGLIGLLFVLAGFLAWVLKSGSLDRPVLGLVAFSFVAEAFPALSQIGLVLLLLILAQRILRRGDLPFPTTVLMLPALLILISYATTFVLTNEFLPIIPTFGYRLTANFLMVALLPAIIRTRRQLEIFFHFLLVSACISVAVEWGQFVLSAAAHRPITFLAGETAYDKVTTSFGTFPRLTGLQIHPNLQSNCVSTLAVLALWFGLRPRKAISLAKRVFYLTAYVWLALGVLFTFSRSGWLALGLASMVVPVFRFPRLAPLYVSVLGLSAAIAWKTGLLEATYHAVENLQKASADFRWRIDHLAIEAFANHPWLGIGTMGILDYFNPWRLQVHDTYKQVLAEMGLFGVLAFGSFMGLVVWHLTKTFLTSRFSFDRDWVLGISLAFVVILIQNAFVMFLWVRFLWLMVILMEIVYLVSRDQTGREPEDLAFLPAPRPNPA